MNQKLKSIIFSILVAISTIAIYLVETKPFFRYLGIFSLMIIAMILAEIILKEEPMEFFDNFSNYKKARISSVFMIIAFYSIIRIIIIIFSLVF